MVPFEVVTRRLPSANAVTERSRPYVPLSASGIHSDSKAPSELKRWSLSAEPFSVATAKASSQVPHPAPAVKSAPLVATVDGPLDHLAAKAPGAVIGTDSS